MSLRISMPARTLQFSMAIPMEDSMIPQEKSAAVTRGLREAFGVTEFEDIRKVTRGHSSMCANLRID